MRGNTFKRLISLALCAAMLVAAAVPVFAEEQTVTSSDGSAGGTSSGYNKTTLADLSDQLSLISYSQYLENHAGVSAGTKEIVINAADYDEKATTAKNITKESGVYGLEDEVFQCRRRGHVFNKGRLCAVFIEKNQYRAYFLHQ